MLFTRNDYYILHNRKLDVEALYSDDPKSKYYYIVSADVVS
jgi:cytosine/uracil/thiamine/allantoin permease